MADNFVTNAGSGGNTFASDDVAGVHYPITKIAFGALDSVTLVTASAGFPCILVANSGVDIGDVDVTSVTPGFAAANLGKRTDDAATTSDVGVVTLAKRTGTPANFSSTDGDYEPLQMSAGRLWTSTQATGSVAHDGVDSGNPVKIGGYASSTAPVAVVDADRVNAWYDLNGRAVVLVESALPAGTNNIGDVDVLTVPAPLSTTGGGTEATALRVTIASDSTGVLSVDDNGGSLTVDGTVSITGAVDTELPAAAALADNTANPTVPAVGSFIMGFDGTNWDRVRADGGSLFIQDGGNSITVDNAGTFAVQATVAAGATNIAKAEDVASADADVGVPAMAVRKATPANTSGTDGDYEFLQMSAGRLWVDASGVTLTVGSHAVTNAGTFAVQDSEKVADDAAFTVATTKVQPAGFLADETATDSVDEGDAGAARMTLDRKQIVALYAHTAGGVAMNSQLSTAAVISTAVKASPGQVYGVHVFNDGANEVFLRLYNQTGAPASTDNANIVYRAMVPGNAAGAGFIFNIPQGMEFTTGIGVRVTGAVADTDTTVLAANEVMLNVLYK